MGVVKCFFGAPRVLTDLDKKDTVEELMNSLESEYRGLEDAKISKHKALYFVGERWEIVDKLRKLDKSTVICTSGGNIGLLGGSANFPEYLLKAVAVGPTLGPVNVVRSTIKEVEQHNAPSSWTSDTRSTTQVATDSLKAGFWRLGDGIKKLASTGTTTVMVLELCSFADQGGADWGGNQMMCVTLADKLKAKNWQLNALTNAGKNGIPEPVQMSGVYL